MNWCWVIYNLKRYTFTPGYTVFTRYLLLTFSRTKSTAVSLWMLLISVYALNKLGTFPLLTSAMSQHFRKMRLSWKQRLQITGLFSKHNSSLGDTLMAPITS
jgi:hypothetical protein